MTLISRAFTVIAFAGSFGRFSSVQNTVHIQFFKEISENSLVL